MLPVSVRMSGGGEGSVAHELLIDIDCLLCFTTSFFFMLNAWSGVLYHISYRDTPVCVCHLCTYSRFDVCKSSGRLFS